MTFRGDDLTTPCNARHLASAAARVSWQPSLYLCGAVGGIGGLAYGPTDGGWAFAHQFAQPDHRRAVFTFVAAETPSNLVAVTAISAAVFFVGDPNETYREWNVESQSLARWPRCTDRSFWWHRPDCFCGPAALRQSGGVPQLPIAAPILSRSACCYVAARCSARMSTARSGRPAENVSGSRPRVPIDRQHFSPP